MIVIDCSATLAWLMPDEVTPQSMQLLEAVAKEGGNAPNLWGLEIANSLLMAERRKRISRPVRLSLLEALKDLPIHIDPYTSEYAFNQTSLLAEKYGLSAYDAAYLELASRLKYPLATYDSDLKKACKTHGVDLYFL